MGRRSRPCNDYFQSAFTRRRSVVHHTPWCTVRRYDGEFKRDLHSLQKVGRFLHHLHVRLAAHNDSYYRFAHAITVRLSFTNLAFFFKLSISASTIVTCPILRKGLVSFFPYKCTWTPGMASIFSNPLYLASPEHPSAPSTLTMALG